MQLVKKILSRLFGGAEKRVIAIASALPATVVVWNVQLKRDLQNPAKQFGKEAEIIKLFKSVNEENEFSIDLTSLILLLAEAAIALAYNNPELCKMAVEEIRSKLQVLSKKDFGRLEISDHYKRLLSQWLRERTSLYGDDACGFAEKRKDKTMTPEETYDEALSFCLFSIADELVTTLKPRWGTLLSREAGHIGLLQQGGSTIEDLLRCYAHNVGITLAYCGHPAWHQTSIPYGTYESLPTLKH